MENKAAYCLSHSARIEVQPSPFTLPGPGEVLVRNRALGINPIDVAQQKHGLTVKSYPHVRGPHI